MMQPAPIRAPPGAQRPAEVRSFRLRAYADADYQAHAQDWELRIRDQVRRANELLEVQFGIHLEVEVRRWDRAERGGPLEAALRQLGSVERGDADWVVGFVGPVPEDAWQDHLGLAGAFRTDFVLRAMLSPADLMRLEIGYDTLSEAEREAMANERRLHRETVALLHEWAHTVGAVHECDGKWIMSERYGVTESGFSPESERLVRLTLAYRGKSGAAARTAFAEAWRAEVARMQSAAWECPVLEKGLAEREALLAKASADADAREAREAYLRGVARSIQRRWQVPKDALPGDGRGSGPTATVLEVRIGAAGALKDARLVQSSGSERLDRAALDAVHAAPPFEPPPPGVFRPDGEVVFHQRFQPSGAQRAAEADAPRASP